MTIPPYLCSMIKSTLIQAAKASASVLKEYFDRSFEVHSKDSLNNLVTEVDKRSEDIIINIINSQHPNHQILSEEIGEIKQESEYKWIIDPIDGTVNYAHRLPICCVSIAVEKAGEIIFGAVYNPFLNEFFFAEKGHGATLNDKKIHVSTNHQLEAAFLVTGFPYHWDAASGQTIGTFERLIRRGVPVRRLGSAALDLCYVACGRFDGFWESNLQPWDSAAGFLIVEESGGKVSDFQSRRYSPYQKEILASNASIHQHLLEVIQQKRWND